MSRLILRATGGFFLENPVEFRDSGGNVSISLASLATGTGRVSDRVDRGPGSKPGLYEVRGIFQTITLGFNIGDAVELYLFQSDGVYIDGSVGAVNASFTGTKRLNGIYIGSVVAASTSAGVDHIGSFADVKITSRYFSLGVYNSSTVRALSSTPNVNRVIFTPVPEEIQ
jgi:hypothetical protein